MRVGISLTSHHPSLSPREAMATTVARAAAAAHGGLDHLTLGDKHSVGADNNYLQGVPTLARVLSVWPADRPAGLLFLLPLWHPVIVAEVVGTLAAMSDARFILQTGIGGGASQFAAMGASLKTRGTRTNESIRVIDGLLRGEEMSSELFGIDGAGIGPRPDVPVDWWVGSGDAPSAIERAALLGDALYLSPGTSKADIARIGSTYRRRCDELERPSRVILRRDVFIGDDDQAALRVGDELAAAGYRGIAREDLICGGVGRAVEMLSPLAELGVDDIVFRTMAVSQEAAVRSVELMGKVREALSKFRG